MKKSMKKYLVIFAIVLPIGGFFVIFQYFFLAKEAEKSKVFQNVLAATIPASTTPKTDGVAATSAPKVTTAAAKCVYPSQMLNLANWKETLPTGSAKKPTEIKQGKLATFAIAPYFSPNSSCDGVVFRAPVNGVTTSGSGYPRSELREMTDNGKRLASWATTAGVHSMYLDQAITAVPKNKKHVVAGQIHDAKDDVVVIRLEYPRLFVDINGQSGPTLDANYTLGKRFTVKFVATNGVIELFYNGATTPTFSMKKATSGNYFKAGAYTQSNCSKETDCSGGNFGEVVIYKLAVQ